MQFAKLSSFVALVTTAGLAMIMASAPAAAHPAAEFDIAKVIVDPRGINPDVVLHDKRAPCCLCGGMTYCSDPLHDCPCSRHCCGTAQEKSTLSALALRAFYGLEAPRSQAFEDKDKSTAFPRTEGESIKDRHVVDVVLAEGREIKEHEAADMVPFVRAIDNEASEAVGGRALLPKELAQHH